MSETPPTLLPILRSENQLRLLAAVLLAPQRSWTVTELAAHTGVPQPSVSREVARLVQTGLFMARNRPGVREIGANVESVIYPELRSMLLKTVGPKSVLESALRGLPGIESAQIYGSWARRYHGEAGPEPQDIDLLVVGRPDIDAVFAIAERASGTLGRDVNLTVLTAEEYQDGASGFAQQFHVSPMVKLDLKM